MDDEDLIMFFKMGIATEEGIEMPEVYRNCDFVQGVMLLSTKIKNMEDRVIYGLSTEYRPDGKIRKPNLNVDSAPNEDIKEMVDKILKTLKPLTD